MEDMFRGSDDHVWRGTKGDEGWIMRDRKAEVDREGGRGMSRGKRGERRVEKDKRWITYRRQLRSVWENERNGRRKWKKEVRMNHWLDRMNWQPYCVNRKLTP